MMVNLYIVTMYSLDHSVVCLYLLSTIGGFLFSDYVSSKWLVTLSILLPLV